MTEMALDMQPRWEETQASSSPRRTPSPAAAPQGTASRPAPPEPRSRFALGLTASLALHGLLALAWLSADWTRPPPPRHDQLLVELFGMVSNRQVEQKQRGSETEQEGRQATPPTPRETPRPEPRKIAKPAPTVQKAPSPVRVAEPQKVEQPQAAVAPPASGQVVKGVEEQQEQQTVAQRESDAAVIRRYAASLTKAIQNKLSYPDEARDWGYTGSPTIRFTVTESGDILPNSLAIHKSSGHPALDEAALRAARASTPLPRPPRQMTVALVVSFARER